MRIVNGKISLFACLPCFGPADKAGGTGGTQESSADEQNQNNVNQQNQDDDLDPDSENIVDDLLGGDDNEDLDFELDEEDDQNDPDEEKRITSSTADLSKNIQGVISAMGVTEDDIDENFDPSNRKQVADLLGKINKRTAEQVIGIIPGILKHALGIVVPRLEKRIDSASVSTSKKNEVTKAFTSLGLKGADSQLGKTFYSAALKRGLSPEKAARATAKALSNIRGGADKQFNSGNNSQNRSGSGTKQGKSALDSMFGSSK